MYFVEDENNRQQNYMQLTSMMMAHLKKAAYHQLLFHDRIQTEFMKSLRSTTEEELHIVLTKILCMS